MDTERIELPNDNWWEIKTVVTRRMRKAFRKAGIQAVTGSGINIGDVLEDPEAVKETIAQNIQGIDIDTIEDSWLLEGTVSFSFGKKITTQVIDDLPDIYVAPVLERIRDLYKNIDEEELLNLDGKQPSTLKAV